jgi:hypothetical protein
MREARWLYRTTGISQGRVMNCALLSAWLGFVLFMALNHVVWRDEARALSLSIQGGNAFAMVKTLHAQGEGHPAAWYLLLRGAHVLFPRPAVLQIVAFAVAAAAILLLVFRSPFGLLPVALIAFSGFACFEYSVMARNYGISMLLMFLFATLYERYRERGFLLGMTLFLLANCNAHSALLVGAFLFFWLGDVMTINDRAQRSQALRIFLFNAIVAALGVVACLLTIFPPPRDSSVFHDRTGGGFTLKLLFKEIFLPARQLDDLMYLPNAIRKPLSLDSVASLRVQKCAMSLIMFGSTLGLIRRPSAFLASLAALIGFSMFFSRVYPGYYRHEALWLVFLSSMYWIAGSTGKQNAPALPRLPKPIVRAASTIGSTLFLLLIALQLPHAFVEVARAAGYAFPHSRSRDFGTLVSKHPELQDAVIMADPDFMVEPLSYYIPNRTYLMREHRYGNVVIFTRKARMTLNLDEILANAQDIRRKTGKPVVILMAVKLDPALPAQSIKEGIGWELVTTPEQTRHFLASTKLIKNFEPAASDESYDVYVLDKS